MSACCWHQVLLDAIMLMMAIGWVFHNLPGALGKVVKV